MENEIIKLTEDELKNLSTLRQRFGSAQAELGDNTSKIERLLTRKKALIIQFNASENDIEMAEEELVNKYKGDSNGIHIDMDTGIVTRK